MKDSHQSEVSMTIKPQDSRIKPPVNWTQVKTEGLPNATQEPLNLPPQAGRQLVLSNLPLHGDREGGNGGGNAGHPVSRHLHHGLRVTAAHAAHVLHPACLLDQRPCLHQDLVGNQCQGDQGHVLPGQDLLHRKGSLVSICPFNQISKLDCGPISSLVDWQWESLQHLNEKVKQVGQKGARLIYLSKNSIY